MVPEGFYFTRYPWLNVGHSQLNSGYSWPNIGYCQPTLAIINQMTLRYIDCHCLATSAIAILTSVAKTEHIGQLICQLELFFTSTTMGPKFIDQGGMCESAISDRCICQCSGLNSIGIGYFQI
jgi:hypothetical protein